MMKNEIACRSREQALKIAEALLEEDYVVLLSREEDLTIINFEYSQYSDRNGVVFMTREEYEEELYGQHAGDCECEQ